MTKISAATGVSSLSGTDKFPVYDGTATAKSATITNIGEYADDRLRAGVKVKINSDFDIASTSTWTEIDWDATYFEEGGDLWDTADPAKLIAPVAGIYAIFANIEWVASATASKIAQTRVKINGTVLETTTEPWINNATRMTTAYLWTLGDLSADDEVTCEVWQDVTNGQDVNSSRTTFGMVLVGRD